MKFGDFPFRILLAAFLLTTSGVIACATSPTGRKQLMIFPDSQVDELGLQSFEQIKQQTPISQDSKQNAFVQCVAAAVTQAATGKTDTKNWEVVVFDQPKTINAFALPGGKIGVYSGILPVTKTDAQLAAVLAHEVGHVIAKHGAERMSQSVVEQGGLAVVGQLTTDQPIVGLALGLATQYGVVLPFSRTQEREADEIGLTLMAEAGFDPHQAVELWKNMEAATGAGPPEFLSTHPSSPNRIQDLEARMGPAVEKFNRARAQGRAPHCEHP